LGYYEPDGRLIHAGRLGPECRLKRLRCCLSALSRSRLQRRRYLFPRRAGAASAGRWRCPRFIWARPELVAEITYIGWTDEPLLRHTVFVGLREDKPAAEVRREPAAKLPQ